MTPTAATIRAATPTDLTAVADIYAHYVRHTVITFAETSPTSADWQRQWDELAGRNLPFLVAEMSGAVAGFAYAGPWRPKPAYRHTVEDTIYLAPEATGQGMGTALLEALLAEAARAGVRQMIAVIADSGNSASVALHHRFGFNEVGRLASVGYKHSQWVDTVLLQRALTAGPSQ